MTHHLEELPSSTTHALLLADGRVVAAGPARAAVTTENVSAAFDHPIDVQFDDGRWSDGSRSFAGYVEEATGFGDANPTKGLL